MCGSSKEVRNEWSVFYLRIKKFNKKKSYPPSLRRGSFIISKSAKTTFLNKFAHRVSLTAAAAQFLRTADVAGERSITRTVTRTRGR